MFTFAKGEPLSVFLQHKVGCLADIYLGTNSIAKLSAILIVRTYALSGCRRSVGIVFTSMWAVGLSATIVLVVFYVRSTVYIPSPFQGIPGCYQAASSTTVIVIVFIMVFVNETSNLNALNYSGNVITVLAVIMAYTLYLGITKYRDVRTPLVVTLYRDGITYYVCLCVVSFWNVFMLLDGRVFPKEALAQILNMHVSRPLFIRVMHSVLSARVILHIRDVERKRCAEDSNGLLPTMGFELGTRKILWKNSEFSLTPRFNMKSREFALGLRRTKGVKLTDASGVGWDEKYKRTNPEVAHLFRYLGCTGRFYTVHGSLPESPMRLPATTGTRHSTMPSTLRNTLAARAADPLAPGASIPRNLLTMWARLPVQTADALRAQRQRVVDTARARATLSTATSDHTPRSACHPRVSCVPPLRVTYIIHQYLPSGGLHPPYGIP
ncbi:hypothetical protein K438DRAFT_1991942 [Mycena galopus ATCC 62051]|nr:hypothetical protein K438DRAFT_1991942 [Mycena galopus ATCC 62051]